MLCKQVYLKAIIYILDLLEIKAQLLLVDEGMVWNPEDYENITLLPVPVAQV